MTRELIAAAKSGDPDAMRQVLEHYGMGPALTVEKLITGIVRALHEPADVIQHVRMVISQKLTTFEQRTDDLNRDFHAWATTIARRHIVDLARRTDRGLTNIESAIFEHVRGDGATPSRLAAQAEAHATLYECLMTLDPDDRDIVLLHFIEDLPDREIAVLKGLSEHAVRGRWQRALPRLKDCLGKSADYHFG